MQYQTLTILAFGESIGYHAKCSWGKWGKPSTSKCFWTLRDDLRENNVKNPDLLQMEELEMYGKDTI